MTTIGYVRVSTEEQAREGYSLKAQKIFIEQYAKEHNINELKILSDNGYSAKDDNRPNYRELIHLIKKKKIKNIIIHKIDRLSRNITDFNNFVNLCSNNNINLISITDNINFNSAIGRGTSNIMISIAQMEREQISERTKAGYIAMLENGEYPFGGKLPLGISKDQNKKLFYNEDIEIIKKIFDLESNKFSFVEIKNKINTEYGNIIRSKDGVERIIKNDLYRGFIIYEGKRYELLKPLIRNKILATGKSIRKKKLANHNYFFHKYLKDDFYVSTKIKKLKTTGEKKEYKYYIHKKEKFKFSEKNLIILLIDNIKIYTEEIEFQKKVMKKKLKDLYLLNQITEKEAKIKLKNLEKDIKILALMEKFKGLEVNAKGEVEVVLLNNNIINFTLNK